MICKSHGHHWTIHLIDSLIPWEVSWIYKEIKGLYAHSTDTEQVQQHKKRVLTSDFNCNDLIDQKWCSYFTCLFKIFQTDIIVIILTPHVNLLQLPALNIQFWIYSEYSAAYINNILFWFGNMWSKLKSLIIIENDYLWQNSHYQKINIWCKHTTIP